MHGVILIGLALVGTLAYLEVTKATYDTYLLTIVSITAIMGGLTCLVALS